MRTFIATAIIIFFEQLYELNVFDFSKSSNWLITVLSISYIFCIIQDYVEITRSK